MADDPYRYFRLEARELIDELTKGVLALERGDPPSRVAVGLLRHAHTLKGAARVIRQPEIADHAHAIEEALEPLRDSAEPLTGARAEDVLAHLDEIRSRVDGLPLPGHAAAPVPASAAAGEPLRTVRTDVGEIDLLLEGVAQAHAHLAPLRSAVAALERARDSAPNPTELRSAVSTLGPAVADGVEQVDRELRQVRDAVERLRLVPAASLFTGLERAVRDVAQAQGKRVGFEGRGGEVRLDAHVLGEVQAALQQLVRNAVAHGIETEHERVGRAKPAAGRVTLSVARRGRRVVFSCHDDGRGIDLDAVRRAALRRGLLDDDRGELAPAELTRLLLHSGLSTSGTVTELSGRGIGLDLVRESADRLRGEVAVTTERDAGTTVELSVPLTLASFEALTVEASGVRALVPLDAIVETLPTAPGDIARTERGEVLTTGGRLVPFLPLSTALGCSAPERPAAERGRAVQRDGIAAAVVVSGEAGRAAIGVSRLLGVAEVVARPLPELVPRPQLVSAVWLDLDGIARLVLDPDGLLAEAGRERPATVGVEAVPAGAILVVDDSLTTRMLEQSILESAGYSVETASSAEDALVKVQTTRYLLFLVDVEMPGMDGLAFIRRTKADPDQRDVPAVLVTSRSLPEDRQRGLDAGASAYVSKGEFDQGKLLELIASLTGC